jgi:hypothetical protein
MFPVNGQWAHWSSWTSCDVTCGKGTRQRSRTCTNPVPANGGLECTGTIRETDECAKDACLGRCIVQYSRILNSTFEYF